MKNLQTNDVTKLQLVCWVAGNESYERYKFEMHDWSSYKSHWNLYSIIALTGCVLVNVCLLVGAIWADEINLKTPSVAIIQNRKCNGAHFYLSKEDDESCGGY
uniref:Uncharacterized protein n=1 Tax=Glossina austeni TaxID=7395 RepID=A0A1A9UP38_GLOAU